MTTPPRPGASELRPPISSSLRRREDAASSLGWEPTFPLRPTRYPPWTKFACVCEKGGADANHDESCPMSACKTRANLRANVDESVPDYSHKPFIYKECSDHHERQADETAVSENSLQTCKLHTNGCPDPELCVQNCTDFAHNILKDRRAASIANEIRSHASQCKIHGRTVPAPDDYIEWQKRLYKEHDLEFSFGELARGMDYIKADREDWKGYVKALSCFGYSVEDTNPISAYKAIQEIREDWAGHELPTDAEWWAGNLEANETPFTLEAIELALAAEA